MISTFRLFVFLVLFVLGAIVVDQYVLACSHNPAAPVEPAPMTMEDGEQAYLNRMHKAGNAIPPSYCWAWWDHFGNIQTACRFNGVLVVGGQ